MNLACDSRLVVYGNKDKVDEVLSEWKDDIGFPFHMSVSNPQKLDVFKSHLGYSFFGITFDPAYSQGQYNLEEKFFIDRKLSFYLFEIYDDDSGSMVGSFDGKTGSKKVVFSDIHKFFEKINLKSVGFRRVFLNILLNKFNDRHLLLSKNNLAETERMLRLNKFSNFIETSKDSGEDW